jgi:hypothetical protein
MIVDTSGQKPAYHSSDHRPSSRTRYLVRLLLLCLEWTGNTRKWRLTTAHSPLNTSKYLSWSSSTVHLANKSSETWTQYRIFSSPSKMTLLSLMTLLWHVCRVSVYHALKLGVLLVLPKFLNVLLFYFCSLIHLIQHRTYMSAQSRIISSIT